MSFKLPAGGAEQAGHVLELRRPARQALEHDSPLPETLRGGLRLHVISPDCWDSERLDSADHQSHMAYSSRSACPRSHPVALPALSLVVQYAASGRARTELASVGQFSAHVDFMNAWDQARLDRLIAQYLN